MLLGKRGKGALLKRDFINQAFGKGWTNYALQLNYDLGNTLFALLTLFKQRRGSYKVKQARYLDFL